MLCVCALLAGCASPGPPRAPSLQLPERTTLAVERIANDVELRFAVPSRTTDGQPVRAAIGVKICRAVDAGACVTAAQLTLPAPVTRTSVPFAFRDALPAELLAAPRHLLSYRVELFGPRGRSAGPSEPAFAAAGPAPRPVEGFAAVGSREGVRLTWLPGGTAGEKEEVVLRRELLTPGPAHSKPKPAALSSPGGASAHPKPRAASNAALPLPREAKDNRITWLLAAAPEETAATDTGSLDTSAKFGDTYSYTAFREAHVVLAGHELTLRSAPSGVAVIPLKDVYPPAVPTGLLAASFATAKNAGPLVDLSWQPVLDADLAGYNVYRQTLEANGAAIGARMKLNAQPVPQPAYEDTMLPAGASCRYSITSIDSAGNESAPSATADFTP